MKLKTIALTLMGVAMISLSACAGRDVRIHYAELPNAVKSFAAKYFEGAKINRVMMDTDDAVTEYDIYLMNGTKIEVNQNGDWKEISNRSQAVPVGMLPVQTQNYIKSNYPNAKVLKIEKDRKGYDVRLNNGLELEFNTQGQFLKIDR